MAGCFRQSAGTEAREGTRAVRRVGAAGALHAAGSRETCKGRVSRGLEVVLTRLMFAPRLEQRRDGWSLPSPASYSLPGDWSCWLSSLPRIALLPISRQLPHGFYSSYKELGGGVAHKSQRSPLSARRRFMSRSVVCGSNVLRGPRRELLEITRS